MPAHADVSSPLPGSDETPLFDRVNADKDGSEGSLLQEAATFAIRRAILEEDKRLRKIYPLLTQQSLLALLLWSSSIALITLNVVALSTWGGVYPAPVALLLSAFAASILHELEHDTIHHLYFNAAGQAWMQDVMFAGIWLAKLSLNPWTRRTLHLLHHKRSGQADDVEERLIGLGVRPVLMRLLIAFFPMSIVLYTRDIHKSNPSWGLLRGSACSPARWLQRVDHLFISAPIWLSVLVWYTQWNIARACLFGWVLPNVLRHACIVLMSSYSHYYGDIPAKDITRQNQILNHWSLLPFQLFCVNFGAEHIIHHYVVGQPFYLRHLVRHAAWKVLIAHGTRVNDFGIVWRANRWGEYNPAAAGVDAKKEE